MAQVIKAIWRIVYKEGLEEMKDTSATQLVRTSWSKTRDWDTVKLHCYANWFSSSLIEDFCSVRATFTPYLNLIILIDWLLDGKTTCCKIENAWLKNCLLHNWKHLIEIDWLKNLQSTYKLSVPISVLAIAIHRHRLNKSHPFQLRNATPPLE